VLLTWGSAVCVSTVVGLHSLRGDVPVGNVICYSIKTIERYMTAASTKKYHCNNHEKLVVAFILWNPSNFWPKVFGSVCRWFGHGLSYRWPLMTNSTVLCIK